MFESKVDKRKKKTSYDQYVIYIKMLEEDNIFRSGVLTREVDVNYLTNKWDELADKLNKCGCGPTLSTEEWKKRLNDWKNSTRAKYRKIYDPSLNQYDKTLTPLEQKALSLWGINARRNYPLNDDCVFDLSKLPALVRTEEMENDITGVDILCKKELPSQEDIEASGEGSDIQSSPIVEEMKEESSPKRKKIERVESLSTSSNVKEEDVACQTAKTVGLRELVAQVKRIADVKEEKLRFEIEKFKFRNPGFKFEFKFDSNSIDDPKI